VNNIKPILSHTMMSEKITGITIVIFFILLMLASLPRLALSLGRIAGIIYACVTGNAGLEATEMAMKFGESVGVIVMYVICIFGIKYGVRKLKKEENNKKSDKVK